jgi:signal transduction histidine kinase
LAVNGNVFGAITFLGNPTTCAFSENDIRLAEGLAVRSALALEKARLYAETLRMKNRAEREAGATAAFLRSVSHELRTPLQAIAGYVEIMVRGIHGPVTNDQRIDLERIIGSQRHLLILINELIEYMRTGGTRGAFEPTAVRIDTAVRRAFDIIEPLANNCKIRFEFDDTCAQLISIADENKLHQILINLMANAVKFTAKGGEISVHCSRTGSQNRIAITDTGRGIPEDKYEAIFEPFTQLRATDRSQEGGLGLGLSISRDLARAMNGDITVQSTVKQGSTFTITLPAGPEN